MFRRNLDIADADDIAVILLDREGTVTWRGSGPYQESIGEELCDTVRAFAS